VKVTETERVVQMDSDNQTMPLIKGLRPVLASNDYGIVLYIQVYFLNDLILF